MATDPVTMDKIVSLSKRRGFVFQSSEIYGGIGSSYDYGHYGVLLKNNVKGQWWRSMLQERDDVVALDSAIIQHPQTWVASGHLAGFTDPLIDCRTCKLRFRADRRLEHQVEVAGFGEVAVGRLAGVLGGLAPAGRDVEVVGAEAQLARAAVDERIGEAGQVPGGHPR